MRARIIDECAAIALAPFDWGWNEAPRTYRALANRIGKRIEALKYASGTETRQGGNEVPSRSDDGPTRNAGDAR